MSFLTAASVLRLREMDLTFNDVPVTVYYEHEPAEPAEVNDFDGGHPGYPANVDVLHVFAGGIEITELLEWELIHKLEDQVLEALQ